MIYQISLSISTRRYLKKLKRSGAFNPSVLNAIFQCLEEGIPLPEKCKDHQLHGEFAHHRECHVGFNLLLVYRRNDALKIITVSDIGTHPELFGE